MFDVDDPTGLSLLFHLNSEPWRNESAYTAEYYVQTFPQAAPDAARVYLPEPQVSAVAEAIAARRSVREFRDVEMPLAELGDILHFAYGIVGADRRDANGVPLRRAVPSAGGSYPLDLFVRTRRVASLADGLYRFDPLHRRLELRATREGFADLARNFYAQSFFTEANALVLLVAHFARTQSKYGPRGYRYILLEAGHVAQNICLLAAERSLGSLCIGGYVDGAVAADLRLDPLASGIVYALALGRPA